MTATREFWLTWWALGATGGLVVAVVMLRSARRQVNVLHREIDALLGQPDTEAELADWEAGFRPDAGRARPA